MLMGNRVLKVGPVVLGAAGLVGTLACVGPMTLAAVGVVGVGAAGLGAAAGMAGMGSPVNPAPSQPDGILALLIDQGPTILLVSIGAIGVSLAAKRRAAIIPTLVGGGLLYWGMYAQENMAMMYASIAVGLVLWAAAYLWAHGPLRHRRRIPF